jgi:hypothetical protein
LRPDGARTPCRVKKAADIYGIDHRIQISQFT